MRHAKWRTTGKRSHAVDLPVVFIVLWCVDFVTWILAGVGRLIVFLLLELYCSLHILFFAVGACEFNVCHRGCLCFLLRFFQERELWRSVGSRRLGLVTWFSERCTIGRLPMTSPMRRQHFAWLINNISKQRRNQVAANCDFSVSSTIQKHQLLYLHFSS